MAHCRKVGPCKSPCNWFSPMAHRDHRIKHIMICLCFGWQSHWHTAIEAFNLWIGFLLIKNIVLHPRSQWHKRFQTPYVAVIHHSCCDYVSGTKTAWHTMVHHLWKMCRLDEVFIANLHGTPDFKIICWWNSLLVSKHGRTRSRTRSKRGPAEVNKLLGPHQSPKTGNKHVAASSAGNKRLNQVPVQTMFHRNIWHTLREHFNT